MDPAGRESRARFSVPRRKNWRSDSNTFYRPALNLADTGGNNLADKGGDRRDERLSWAPPCLLLVWEGRERNVHSGFRYYLHISALQSPRWGWTSPGLAGIPRCSPPPIPPHLFLPQPSCSRQGPGIPRPDPPDPAKAFLSQAAENRKGEERPSQSPCSLGESYKPANVKWSLWQHA